MPARRETALALFLVLVLALLWTIPLSTERSAGWDESMHAELPAARILVALRAGEVGAAFDALLDCEQYPFVYPLVLAAAQAVFGLSEHVARSVGTLVWCATLCGLFLLGRELVRERLAAGERWARIVPWLALAFGAGSPLALAYAGTLFLEVPFACASVWTLRAWLVRARAGNPALDRRRDLAAGAWLTAAIFTKFNYGVLLALGLALDWLVEAVLAIRAGAGSRYVRRSAWLAAIPLVAGLWWFLMPLPAGLAVGAEHRAAFGEFLAGNQELARVPWEQRVLYAGAYFVPTPRLLALMLAGALATLLVLRERAVLTLWLALLALVIPIERHPFHLDRFLIPCGVALWVLAAFGVARLLPRQAVARMLALALLVWATCASPRSDRIALADRLGQLQVDPFLRAYQERIFTRWGDLSGARSLPTAGLERASAERLLDAIATEVGPDARVGWIGISSELSPAALHLGLLARGGAPERLLRDAQVRLDVSYFHIDPAWSDAEFSAFAAGFDVLLYTDPIDLKRRASRAFLASYAARLTGSLGWKAREIARVDVSRPLQEPLVVTLFACRRVPTSKP